MGLQFLRQLYGLSLILFPKEYREEYGDELQVVFGLSIEDAATKGGFEVERLVLRELLSLPKAVVLEHLRQRRKAAMIRRFDSYFDLVYGSWKEFLTALLPFFLAGVALPLPSFLIRLKVLSASSWVGPGIIFTLFGLFVILFILGLVKGLPRWSLPYFGFVLSLLSVYVMSGFLGFPIFILVPHLFDQWGLLGDIVLDGFFWFGLLIAIGLLAVASRVSPAFAHLRNDWTLLCFILYGAVPFALWLTFDEYVGDEPYSLLAFLVLALGAWFYLRSSGEWKRFGVLFAALALAMFIVTVGKAILVPTQDWPITIDAGLAKSEAKHTIIMGGWLALGMLIPLGIKLLPHPNASRQVSALEE